MPHKNGPAWYHPGNGKPRQGAMVKTAHTASVVDLILEDGSVATLVPFHEMPDDPHFRHAYQPDPNDNVDLEAIRASRWDRTVGIPRGPEVDEPEPDGPMEFDSMPGSDPGDEDDHGHGPGHVPGSDPQPGHGNDAGHGHQQGGKGHKKDIGW